MNINFDRSKSPQTDKAININLPEIEKHEIGNAKIIFVKKNKLPIVQLNLLVEAGSKFDISSKLGLANFVTIMIDEGADEYDALELNNQLNLLGSAISISCNHDYIHFSLLSLKENFSRTLELLGKIVNTPRMEEKDFTREKSKMLSSLLQLKDDADELANRVFEKIVYGKENPYTKYILGFPSTVNRINNEDVRDYYNVFLKPLRQTFVAAGDIDSDELIKLIKNNFDLNESKNKAKEINYVAQFQPQKIFIVHKENSVQTEIRVGHPTAGRNDGNYFPRLVLNTILGGQFTSRINLNLREKRGFTYGANTFFKFNKIGGYFAAATSVNVENTGEAVNEILKEFNLIKENILDNELTFAKSALIRRFPLSFETYTQIAASLNTLVIYNLPLNYFDNYMGNVEAVNLDEVKDAALKNVFSENSVIVLAGDKEKIAASLKQAGKNNFTELTDEGEYL
jgi:zinc protease